MYLKNTKISSMLISKEQLQKIVEELEATIHKNINIMDAEGCVIASMDPSRIGSIHSGAIQVIEQNLDELVIHDDLDYAGSKSGINLPIVLNNKIVGVVGITGDPKEVSTYGKIIKKLTEMMIIEHYRNSLSETSEAIKRNFVFEWLFDINESNINSNNFQVRSKLLGINVYAPRIAVVFNILYHIGQNEENVNIEKQKFYARVIRTIEKYIAGDPQEIALQVGIKIIVLFHTGNVEHVKNLCRKIITEIEKKYAQRMFCGIGTPGQSPLEVRRSFREAETSCSIAIRLKNKRIKIYNETDIDLLLDSIPEYNRNVYFNKVFKNCTPDEIPSWISILRCYMDNNGSINKTADDLFIHKNTLQYRLKKLTALTGYDVRKIEEAIPLYIAVMIYEFRMQSDNDTLPS